MSQVEAISKAYALQWLSRPDGREFTKYCVERKVDVIEQFSAMCKELKLSDKNDPYRIPHPASMERDKYVHDDIEIFLDYDQGRKNYFVESVYVRRGQSWKWADPDLPLIWRGLCVLYQQPDEVSADLVQRIEHFVSVVKPTGYLRSCAIRLQKAIRSSRGF